jgi:hypothetical protein
VRVSEIDVEDIVVVLDHVSVIVLVELVSDVVPVVLDRISDVVVVMLVHVEDVGVELVEVLVEIVLDTGSVNENL